MGRIANKIVPGSEISKDQNGKYLICYQCLQSPQLFINSQTFGRSEG